MGGQGGVAQGEPGPLKQINVTPDYITDYKWQAKSQNK